MSKDQVYPYICNIIISKSISVDSMTLPMGTRFPKTCLGFDHEVPPKAFYVEDLLPAGR